LGGNTLEEPEVHGSGRESRGGDLEADALEVELDEGSWRVAEEIAERYLIDFDSERRIVALLGASRLFPPAAHARPNDAA